MMNTIKIHGDDWDLDYILEMLEDVKRDKLVSARWQPRDALVRVDGSRATIYTGQDFDPTQYEIKQAFWDHDHCQVCMWTLSKSDDPEKTDGFTDGHNWLCKECHRRFVEGLREFQRKNELTTALRYGNQLTLVLHSILPGRGSPVKPRLADHGEKR